MSNNNLGKMIVHQYYFKGGKLYRRTVWDRSFINPDKLETFIQSKKTLADRQSQSKIKKAILDDVNIYIRVKRQFIEYKEKISGGELKAEETYEAE